MRHITKSVAFALLLVVAVSASTLYAESAKRGAMMGSGMMGQGGMSGMMGQMSRMMEHCNQMMQGRMEEGGSEKPNEQWREEAPAQRRKNS